MSFQSDALSWLTVVRNRQHLGDDLMNMNHNDICLIKPTPNRWLINEKFDETFNGHHGSEKFASSLSTSAATTFRANNSNLTGMIQDEDRDKETAELMSERERRRNYKWKTLILQRAPPTNPCESVPVMAFGFDSIDTRNFQSNIAQMFGGHGKGASSKFRTNNNNNKTSSSTNVNNSNNNNAAKQAFANVEQKQQNILNNNNANAATTSSAGSGSGLFRISDEGICVAHGLKTVAELDYIIHQLQNNNTQRNIITALDVSNSKAFQQFDQKMAGPLMKKFLPLAFFRDDCPWLRISSLIADNCDLHDFDADFISDAIREPTCSLERISVKNNIVTEKGAERFKKAVKYNNRIVQIELNGNPCTQKQSEKTKQIFVQMEERLAVNRKKAMASGR